jgi:hypothetical protein
VNGTKRRRTIAGRHAHPRDAKGCHTCRISQDAHEHDNTAVATILALAGGPDSFSGLLHKTGARQAGLVSALAELRVGGFLQNHDGSFQLTAKGMDLVEISRRRDAARKRGGQSPRRAA